MMRVFYLLLFVLLLPFTFFHMIFIWRDYCDAPKWFRYITDKVKF